MNNRKLKAQRQPYCVYFRQLNADKIDVMATDQEDAIKKACRKYGRVTGYDLLNGVAQHADPFPDDSRRTRRGDRR